MNAICHLEGLLGTKELYSDRKDVQAHFKFVQ